MLYAGQPRVISLVAVQSCKPEQLVSANVAAQTESPLHFTVRRGIGFRRKHGRSGECGWRGFFYPLGEGILRAPRILAIEQKGLPVQPVGPAAGLHFHAPAGGSRCCRLHIAGNRLHFSDCRLAGGSAAPARPTTDATAQGETPICAVHSDCGRLLGGSTKRNLVRNLAFASSLGT